MAEAKDMALVDFRPAPDGRRGVYRRGQTSRPVALCLSYAHAHMACRKLFDGYEARLINATGDVVAVDRCPD